MPTITLEHAVLLAAHDVALEHDLVLDHGVLVARIAYSDEQPRDDSGKFGEGSGGGGAGGGPTDPADKAVTTTLPAGTTMYHATRRDDADPLAHPSANGESGPGTYVSTDKAYADKIASYDPSMRVVEMRTTAPFHVLDRTKPGGEERYRELHAGQYRNPEGIAANVKAAGFDGVRQVSPGEQHPETTILSPEKVEYARQAATWTVDEFASAVWARLAADWDEEDHPRDASGKFGEGGGGKPEPSAEQLIAINDAGDIAYETAILDGKSSYEAEGLSFKAEADAAKQLGVAWTKQVQSPPVPKQTAQGKLAKEAAHKAADAKIAEKEKAEKAAGKAAGGKPVTGPIIVNPKATGAEKFGVTQSQYDNAKDALPNQNELFDKSEEAYFDAEEKAENAGKSDDAVDAAADKASDAVWDKALEQALKDGTVSFGKATAADKKADAKFAAENAQRDERVAREEAARNTPEARAGARGAEQFDKALGKAANGDDRVAGALKAESAEKVAAVMRDYVGPKTMASNAGDMGFKELAWVGNGTARVDYASATVEQVGRLMAGERAMQEMSFKQQNAIETRLGVLKIALRERGELQTMKVTKYGETQKVEVVPADKVIEAIERSTGPLDPMVGLAGNYTDRWAETSGDTQADALAMQVRAAEMYGGTVYYDTRSTRGARIETEAKAMAAAQAPLMDAYLEGSFRATQDFFKEQGITHVTLYRGVEGAPKEHTEGAVVPITSNPLSSWSTSMHEASNFGPTIYTASIPVAYAAGSPLGGMGCANEQEIVIGALGAENQFDVTVAQGAGSRYA